MTVNDVLDKLEIAQKKLNAECSKPESEVDEELLDIITDYMLMLRNMHVTR